MKPKIAHAHGIAFHTGRQRRVGTTPSRAGERGGETHQDGRRERQTEAEAHRGGGDQASPAERTGQNQRGGEPGPSQTRRL